MPTAVDIFISDDSLIPAPVAGVVVALLDPSTLIITTQATTDLGGLASVLVSDGTYQVRCFKAGYSTPVAQIIVDHTAPTNKFDATAANLTALPMSSDPRLCRCTGTFVNFENSPTPGVTFRVIEKTDFLAQTPKVVDGRLVFSSEMAFQTDTNGKVSIDLFRGGDFFVMFAGDDDNIYEIKVPDRSSVNLIDLIFPTTVSFAWDSTDAPSNAVSLAVNEAKIVHMSILFSDFETRTQELNKWINFSNSDGQVVIMGVTPDGSGISLVGRTAGSAEVTGVIAPGLQPFRVPDYALTVPPLLVTVTP